MYPVALNIQPIGTLVKKKSVSPNKKKDKLTYRILDIGIFDDSMKPCALSVGNFHYLLVYENNLDNTQWVPHNQVYTLPSVADEGQQLSQVDIDSDLVAQAFDMVSWKAGLEPRPDNSKLPEIATTLMAIQYDKEGGYGSSWKGKGEYRGIMSNIDRKYDRLDKITTDEIEGTRKTLAQQEALLNNDYDLYSQEVGESKVDAVADLTNYGLLYMTWLKETYPLVFNVWVDKNVPKYLRDKIPFLQK